MHDRIAGVAGDAARLQQMRDFIDTGNYSAAATLALDHPDFYRVTLRNLFTPATNKDGDKFAPLNDFSATVIGMIRDDIAFDTVLSADIVYVGAGGLGLPAYSMNDNDHYEAIESRGLDLRTALVRSFQTDETDLPAEAVAGVMTTRAAAAAFFELGTNRAMLRFMLMNFLCRDLEQVKDTSRPADRIRQDVSRSPGGDSRIFLNNCVGCHSGMDPLAQAFAYHDYDVEAGRIVYTSGQVQPKYHINETNFPFGYRTDTDRWDNYWREGPNVVLGWDEQMPASGNGAASLGAELAASEAFAGCQAGRAFEAMCLRVPGDAADRSKVDEIARNLRDGGFRMKQAFADAAIYCMGE